MLALGRKIRVLSKISAEIHSFLSDSIIEKGGVIFTNGDNTIVKFTPDLYSCNCTETSYTPDTKKLSEIINNTVSDGKLFFAGFVHSHPNNSNLSDEDIAYVRKVLSAIQSPSLICGIFDITKNILKLYRIYPYKIEVLTCH